LGTDIGEEVQMPIYKTILLRKEEVADGTMAFHFECDPFFAKSLILKRLYYFKNQ